MAVSPACPASGASLTADGSPIPISAEFVDPASNSADATDEPLGDLPVLQRSNQFEADGSTPRGGEEQRAESTAESPATDTEPPAPTLSDEALEDTVESYPTQSSSMNQALNTGDVILGSMSGIPGGLTSPFLGYRPSSAPILRIGIFTVRASASVGVVSHRDSGVSADGKQNQISSLLQGTLEARLGGRALSSATLHYGFGITYPKTTGREDTSGFDQQLSVASSFVFPEHRKIRFGIGLDYAGLSGIDRDTGAATDRTLATASLSANYDYSRKTGLSTSLSVPIREFGGQIGSRGLNSTTFISHQLTRKTQTGLGYTVGMLSVEGGSTQVFQQPLVHLTYTPSIFFSFDGTAGVDFRKADGGSAVTAIYGAGARWSPRAGTSIMWVADRRVFNSASIAESNFTSTSIALSLGQSLGRKLSASLSFGYELADYDSLGDSNREERRDHLYQTTASLQYVISNRWSCSISATVGENRSNLEPFTFSRAVFLTSYAF